MIKVHSTSSDSVTFCKSFLVHLVSRWLWEPTYVHIISTKVHNCAQDRNTQKQPASSKNHGHSHIHSPRRFYIRRGSVRSNYWAKCCEKCRHATFNTARRFRHRRSTKVLHDTECIVEGHSILWNNTRSVFHACLCGAIFTKSFTVNKRVRSSRCNHMQSREVGRPLLNATGIIRIRKLVW